MLDAEEPAPGNRDLDLRLVRVFALVRPRAEPHHGRGTARYDAAGSQRPCPPARSAARCALFERNRSVVRPTDQGLALLEHAHALVAATDAQRGAVDVGMGRPPRRVPGTSRLRYPAPATDSTPGPRTDEELAAAFDLHLEQVPHDNTMLEAIGHGQMTGETPPVLVVEGMRDHPGAEFFHFSPLNDVQPYYPWRIF